MSVGVFEIIRHRICFLMHSHLIKTNYYSPPDGLGSLSGKFKVNFSSKHFSLCLVHGSHSVSSEQTRKNFHHETTMRSDE